jgi:hypothetical protein
MFTIYGAIRILGSLISAAIHAAASAPLDIIIKLDDAASIIHMITNKYSNPHSFNYGYIIYVLLLSFFFSFAYFFY